MGQMRRYAKGDRTLARIYVINNRFAKNLNIVLGTEAIKCYIKEQGTRGKQTHTVATLRKDRR